MLLIAICAFLIIFSLLILIHEGGHFASARFFGVKVEEFGLGMPPKGKVLFKDKHKTEYTLNWLPLGGFVRMKGEDAVTTKLLKDKDSFAAIAVWKRIVIVIAGVTMNFLMGFILLVAVFSIGSSQLASPENVSKLITENPAAQVVDSKLLGILIDDVAKDGVAESAEIKKYDFISAVEGEIVNSGEQFQKLIKEQAGKPTTLSITRRDYQFEVTVIPSSEGLIGVKFTEPLMAITLRYPFVPAVKEAGSESIRLTKLIVRSIGSLFGNILHGKLPADIGGPVAIAKETFYRASSFIALLNFAAMLSITLAIFNILPIPALDGGRLLFLLFELITRYRANPKMEAYIHFAGYILLLGLIAVISWQDIFK
jgi:regulator of sigma E protease